MSKGLNLSALLSRRVITDADKKISSAAELQATLKQKLQERAAAILNKNAEAEAAEIVSTVSAPTLETSAVYTPEIHPIAFDPTAFAIGMDGNRIDYSPKQRESILLAASGNSHVLIGPAGSGKTTTSRGAILALLEQGKFQKLPSGHKYLKQDIPGAVICSFTRRAVNNIRKVTPASLKDNCITIHKLLEFQPTEVWNEDKARMTKQFKPARNKDNKLPSAITAIVIEEAGMVSVPLFEQLIDALPDPDLVQFIFIGDLYQLPPPMDSAILGYKMLELPVVELDRVYRQGADSPIIDLAWRIKQGDIIPAVEKKDERNPLRKVFPAYDKVTIDSGGLVEIRAWQKKLSPMQANAATVAFVLDRMDKGLYDPEEDIILCPFEKRHGRTTHEDLVSTMNINNLLAEQLGKRRGAEVFEINARGTKSYFAVGDRVLVDKEDGVIISIRANKGYVGEPVQEPSVNLSRNGVAADGKVTFADMADINVDDLLDAMSGEEDVSNQASHVITVQMDGYQRELSSAGDINALLFAYAITVYKAQGSEWRRVFIVVHSTHAVALCNEMLYTAVTRAKEQVVVLCEVDTFDKGVRSRKIKGRTLEEKALHFKGLIAVKQQMMNVVTKKRIPA